MESVRGCQLRPRLCECPSIETSVSFFLEVGGRGYGGGNPGASNPRYHPYAR
jgi:hypothetical protein